VAKKKSKSFDCVEMKNRIQARHRKEWAGLTDEEARCLIQEELSNGDDVVSRKWRRLKAREVTSS
jgi:hypothetical protein